MAKSVSISSRLWARRLTATGTGTEPHERAGVDGGRETDKDATEAAAAGLVRIGPRVGLAAAAAGLTAFANIRPSFGLTKILNSTEVPSRN